MFYNEFENVKKNIKGIEYKKSYTLDLVIIGEINKDSLKEQFKRLDLELNSL